MTDSSVPLCLLLIPNRSQETGSGTPTTPNFYDADNRVTQVTNGGLSQHYTYDAYGRTSQAVVKNGSSSVLTKAFSFQTLADGRPTTQISSLRNTATGYDVTLTYGYDDNGNIISVSDGTNSSSYVYDSANQLIRENNQAAGKTWVWTYDDAGNILSRTEYAYTTGELGDPVDTVAYAYGDTDWGDLLTSYDGNAITYDTIGNPLSDGVWSYTWQNGRELASMTNGATTWSFTYDANGMRKTRNNGTDTYTYVYNGSQLVQMTKGTDVLYFDHATGTVTWTDTATETSTVYYYVYNLQGDVVAILDSTGSAVVNYAYDAWGNLLATTGSMASTLGTLNPLTYRGYVYDFETGLYYLQSRYYNPEVSRFINADALVATGQGLLGNNMFAYCGNNPVNCKDPTGEFAISISALILIGSAVVGACFAGYTAYKEYQAGFDTVQIIGDSAVAGMSAFMLVYSMGMTAYQCYQNYCYLNGLTPVTQIGGQGNVSSQLQTCADTANTQVSGNGAVAGTHKHTAFANEVNNLGNSSLRTEVSYLNGNEVPYGTKGSIRFDVMQFGANGAPISAWDFKTGAATLTEARISQMHTQSGLNIPIFMIK